MFRSYAAEAAFALDAVREAAVLARLIQRDLTPHTIAKSDRSPVTVADFASQAVVARMLEERFPSDALVGEEDSRVLREPGQTGTLEAVTRYASLVHERATQDEICRWIDRGASEPGVRFWTYDPIDGTKGFLRDGQYVTALALIDDGQVMVAAMGCPNLNAALAPEVGSGGCAVVSVRGEGAWALPLVGDARRRLAVSDQADPARARVLRSYESGHTDAGKIEALMNVLAVAGEPLRLDSAAKYAMLAAGEGELLFRLLSVKRPDYREKIWDQAAGSLIVEEAGGRVTDLRGAPLDFGRGRELSANFGVLASNGVLHDRALEAVRVVGADQRPEAA